MRGVVPGHVVSLWLRLTTGLLGHREELQINSLLDRDNGTVHTKTPSSPFGVLSETPVEFHCPENVQKQTALQNFAGLGRSLYVKAKVIMSSTWITKHLVEVFFTNV